MTRGKIIYINNDSQVYATCEFNGDMHPHRHGEDISEHFQNGLFQDYKSCIFQPNSITAPKGLHAIPLQTARGAVNV